MIWGVCCMSVFLFRCLPSSVLMPDRSFSVSHLLFSGFCVARRRRRCFVKSTCARGRALFTSDCGSQPWKYKDTFNTLLLWYASSQYYRGYIHCKMNLLHRICTVLLTIEFSEFRFQLVITHTSAVSNLNASDWPIAFISSTETHVIGYYAQCCIKKEIP